MKTHELRAGLYGLLIRVSRGERIVVEKHRARVAALVSLADYERLQALDVSPEIPQERIMQTHRIVVTNIAGGEGKTTTAREVGAALVTRGYRVGLVDLDPQASLTKSLGLHDRSEPHLPCPAELAEHTVLSVLASDDGALPAPLRAHGMDVWPANGHLRAADAQLGDLSRMGNLREALGQLAGYDFLLLDTKPSVSALLYAAIAASDHLVVPVNGIKGLENLDELAKLLKFAKAFSPDIGVRLWVPNRLSLNLRHHKNILASLQQYESLAPVSTVIGDRKAAVGQSIETRTPVVMGQPTSQAALEFQQLAEDVLNVLGLPARRVSEVTP